MIKVVEVNHLAKGEYALICEKLPEVNYDGSIKTNIGMFFKGQYSIGKSTACFTDEPSYAILIHSDLDCSKINSVEFQSKG